MKGCNCGTVHKESHAPDCAGFAVEHAILSHEISLLEEELANLETERDAARQHGIDTTNAAHAEAQRFQALAIEREAQVVKLRAAVENLRPACLNCQHLLHQLDTYECGAPGCKCSREHRKSAVLYAEVRWSVLNEIY